MTTANTHPASLTADEFTAALTRATDAGSAYLSKLYGAGTDATAVKLARNIALTVAQDARAPRTGESRQLVLNAMSNMDADAIATCSALTLAGAARAALNARNAAKAAKRAEDKAAAADRASRRQAAHDIANDRGAAKSARMAAFEEMAAVDAETASLKDGRAEAKHGNARERFALGVIAARRDGLTAHEVLAAILDAYTVEAVSDVLADYATAEVAA